MIYSLMAVVFVLGYLAIALEHSVHIDKAASALFTAVIIWTLLVMGAGTLLATHATDVTGGAHSVSALINTELRHHLADIAEILFFLMGAMGIVELILIFLLNFFFYLLLFFGGWQQINLIDGFGGQLIS